MGAAHGKKVTGQLYSGMLERWRNDGDSTICSHGACFASKAADGSEGLEGKDLLLGVGVTYQGWIK